MRYPASEKLEIIQLVEQSHLPARHTLQKLGIPRAPFHRWYDRFLTGGVEALENRRPWPKRVWNRIPEAVRERIIELALNRPELSPRELAVTFTDAESYFVSEASVYRLLKAPRPDHQPGLHRHQGGRRVPRQDDRPEPAVADRLHLSEGHRLGLVLSVDYPRRLLPLHHRLEVMHHHAGRERHRHAQPGTRRIRMRQLQAHAAAAAAFRQRPVLHRRRPGRLALGEKLEAYPRIAQPPPDPGQDRTLAPDDEEPHPARKLLLARRSRSPDRSLRRALQSSALSREPRQSHARRRLLRARPDHAAATTKDQAKDHRTAALAPSQGRRLI